MHHTWKRADFSCAVLFIILLLGLLPGQVSAEPLEADIGDDIPLSGTAVGVDRVYLFMTGPGVPPGGSRMDSSISPVVTGDPNTFTQVDVSNDRWNYTWRTGRVSGGLAAGTYTIYAATMPVARDDLAGVPYSDTAIILSRPVTTGTITVVSTPGGAQVTLNGRYAGDTPLNLPDLAPGTYVILIESPDYLPVEQTVQIAAGDVRQVDVVLMPENIPTSVETSPPYTTMPPTTTPPGTPAGVPIPAAVALWGTMIAFLLAVRRAGR